VIVWHGDRDGRIRLMIELTIRSTLLAGRRSKPINRIEGAAPSRPTKLDLGVAVIQSDMGARYGAGALCWPEGREGSKSRSRR
jgi:hypothetical protein